MTLYHYDHCPYCVKARMIFGFKNIPVTEQILLNDDEATPTGMIGQKMLPILSKDDGEAMGESLDIIAYADHLSVYGEPIVQNAAPHKALGDWMQAARAFHYALAMPRWVQMGLEEFSSEGAVAYFTAKKEKSIGPFKNALAQTSVLKTQAESALVTLEAMFSFETFVHGKLSLDDFHLFSTLRVLTTVKGLVFPAKIQSYAERISKLSQVPLHWELSL